jgi:hypothetical protein
LEGIPLPDMGAISWLSESPTSDSLPSATCQAVDVMFDADGLEQGDYEGDLIILSNDLVTPLIEVNTLLTVGPQPTFLPFMVKNH